MLTLASAPARNYTRGILLNLMEQEKILSNITVGRDARCAIESTDWETYWRLLKNCGSMRVKRSLGRLHSSWCSRIQSGFANSGLQRHCFDYFNLLEAVLAQRRAPVILSRKMLSVALSFECFGIRDAGADGRMLAAGTTTQRNPCYLLAKLKQPKALDDCQFLPLVTVRDQGRYSLFYHYRQHRLSAHAPTSLLLYLAVSQKNRPDSFRIVNALECQIGRGSDPRADERAKRIAHNVLRPYLDAWSIAERTRKTERPRFELLDLGSGSGLLAVNVCKEICRQFLDKGLDARIRVWLIDLCLSDSARFFAGPILGKATDHLSGIAMDYMDWLTGRRRLPKPRGIRVALASRFFNNLSEFEITPMTVSDFAQISQTDLDRTDWRTCLPTSCLGASGKGPEALATSNTRIWLPVGRSFAQMSLSRYFQGLRHLASRQVSTGAAESGREDVFLPVRRSRPECLLTHDGTSVFNKLLEDCRLVILQDADLCPEDLLKHRRSVKLTNVAAIDMTKTLGLRGHFSYVLLRHGDPGMHVLKGSRLW